MCGVCYQIGLMGIMEIMASPITHSKSDRSHSFRGTQPVPKETDNILVISAGPAAPFSSRGLIAHHSIAAPPSLTQI